MTTFSAHVELRFEADSLEAGRRRLHELMQAARAVGFEMVGGRVEPAPPGSDSSASGWSQYTPEQP